MSETEQKKKKKQHFVPQFYLKRFTDDGNKLFVFDKFSKKSFHTHVNNVANESYFYDFPEDVAREFNINSQLVEDTLSDIEDSYSKTIDKILQGIQRGTKRVLKARHKTAMSYFIALQATRTKEYRSLQTQMIEKQMEAVLAKGYNISPSDEYFVPPDEKYVPLLQSASMFGPVVENLSKVLRNHIWVIYVNQTNTPFYSSDHPVVRIPHKKDPHHIRSFAGFGSEGVEVALPITPKYILAIYERTFHKYIAKKDCETMPLDNVEYIKYYNSMQVAQSHRQIYCPSDSFDLALEMCNTHPELSAPDRPRVLVD